MMVIVALTGVLSAAVIDRARRGSRLIDLGYIRFVENEPLVNPTKVRAINRGRIFLDDGYVHARDWARIILEDGREVVINEGPLLQASLVLEDPSRGKCAVEVQTEADGSAKVHARERIWVCGSCLHRGPALVHIPLFPRTFYLNRKVLVGTGKIAEGAVSLSRDDPRAPAM
jgi:hypothetical protein